MRSPVTATAFYDGRSLTGPARISIFCGAERPQADTLKVAAIDPLPNFELSLNRVGALLSSGSPWPRIWQSFFSKTAELLP